MIVSLKYIKLGKLRCKVYINIGYLQDIVKIFDNVDSLIQ